MASIVNIFICVAISLVIYYCLGFSLTARVVPRRLAAMLAPGVGWAVHSAVALPLFFIVGLSRATVIVLFALPLIAAIAGIWQGRADRDGEAAFDRFSILALIGASLLAAAVMAGVVPKVSAEGVSLAGPIFDHSKVAVIDEMARLGVPPGNPFFGGADAPARLSYYYLWHFSAAELSLLANVIGWEADAALTWFTGFASLAAMIGLAIWFSGRASSALWVVLLSATASLRPLLNAIFGVSNIEQVAGYQSGFGGWLFQTSWAPQHTAGALCAILAVFFLVETVERFSVPRLVLCALSMAAGFESSAWIGGIVLPFAALTVSLVLLAQAEPARRMGIVVHLASAALLALLLISPLLYDQLQMAALRGSPIAAAPYEVFQDHIFGLFGQAGNLSAFWLVFLVVEFPAFYLAGLFGLAGTLKNRSLASERKPIVRAFTLLLVVSLAAAWLLKSTLGENNDLGWRAVLPAAMLLIVFSATGLSRWQKPLSVSFIAAVGLILLSLPDSIHILHGNLVAELNASSKPFAETPALWQAVRRHAGKGERVANNPLFMEHMTPWGANISWALLANRRSCYAGDAYTAPFTALPSERRDAIDEQFVRVFDGHEMPGDIEALATQFNCSVAVVTPQDGAWQRDPFASSRFYRLAEDNAGWRIYQRTAPR